MAGHHYPIIIIIILGDVCCFARCYSHLFTEISVMVSVNGFNGFSGVEGIGAEGVDVNEHCCKLSEPISLHNR